MDESRERRLLDDYEQRVKALRDTSAFDVTDGRVANRLRNRDRVIEAVIELVSEGRNATVDEIVERSGVARRSIFRHFGDLADLMFAAYRRVLADLAPIAILEDLGVGSQDQRIEAYVDGRLRLLPHMHPFRIAARARLADVEGVRTIVTVSNEMVRAQVASQFAAELADRPRRDAELLADSIFAMTSFESYDLLVHQLGRSVDDVRAMWMHATRVLLHG